MTATHHTAPGPTVHGRQRAVAELAAGLVPLLVVAGVTASRFGLPAMYLLRTIVVYALMARLILRHVPPSGAGLGPANWVTLSRATLVLSVAALVPQPEILVDAGYWWIIGVMTVAMVLDGVDGRIARRTGTATTFGARFDMERDSFVTPGPDLCVLSGRGGRGGLTSGSRSRGRGRRGRAPGRRSG